MSCMAKLTASVVLWTLLYVYRHLLHRSCTSASQSAFSSNLASAGSGGALALDTIYEPLHIIASNFTNNTAGLDGGAMVFLLMFNHALVALSRCSVRVRHATDAAAAALLHSMPS